MRAGRLLTMVLLLQSREQVSARELAERLEVSQRTVQRDVEELLAAGVPVRSVRGPAGGYRLDGYRSKFAGLSPAEAEAVSFLGLAGPAAALGLGDVLGGVRLKVRAGLSPEGRERSDQVSARFHLDTDRWFGTAEPAPALAALARAVWEDQRVRVRHAGREGERERVLDPLGLVLKGEWYLLARRDGELRTYRVSRLREVEVLAEPARRPEGFDLRAAWAEHLARAEAARERVEAVVRAREEVLPGLRRVASASAQDAVPVVADGLARDGLGRVEVTVVFDSERWAVMALLGFGAAVEVLAPPWLRAEVAATAAATARLYEEPPSA
ncbi:helix-turn-helix transcriptional regulator [Kineococcus sp. SYSU DK004]|uniref:helix-turn-helix transcriptional regulator n=1 Tax=Kineococcus sp. SYSU DK004 TaxID=3383125 RepID=UPI003D7DC682